MNLRPRLPVLRLMRHTIDASAAAPNLPSDEAAADVLRGDMTASITAQPTVPVTAPRPARTAGRNVRPVRPPADPVPTSRADQTNGANAEAAGVDAERAEQLEALSSAEAPARGRLRTAAQQREERRIARRLAKRDPQGLADLHALTSRAAFAAIVGIVRDPGYAEDVHQQVYAELWRRAGEFDPARGTLLSWVMTIARSRALDHVRRRTDQPTDADVLVALGGSEDDRAFQDVIDRALIGEALARIPAQERDLLRMRFWEGLSQTEIAERTGQPLGTVKSRMLAGLRNLRLHLDTEESS